MTIDIGTITSAVAAIGAVAASGSAVLPLFFWGRKMNLDTLQTVAHVAQQVVAALEQTQSDLSGDQKKQLALGSIRSILSSLGVAVPEPFVDAAVEAAVLALGRPSAPPPSVGAPPVAPATPATATVVAGPGTSSTLPEAGR